MALFFVLLSLASILSTRIGIVANTKLGFFGKIMKSAFGWK